MLRVVAIVLLAANLLFFGFTRGWFDGLFGLSSIGDREPERVASQIRPHEIVVTPLNGRPTSSAAARGGCLEAGPIAAADASAAEAILKIALAPGAWVDNRSESMAGGSVVVTHTYRVAAADPALAARLAALKLDASGRGFSPCAKSGDAIR
ncbi:MAG: hypothetical protein ABI330_14820 [Caldimonas sp.]